MSGEITPYCGLVGTSTIETNSITKGPDQNNPSENLKNCLKDLAKHVFSTNKLTLMEKSELESLAYIIDCSSKDGNLDKTLSKIKKCDKVIDLFNTIGLEILDRLSKEGDDPDGLFDDNNRLFFNLASGIVQKGGRSQIGGFGEECPSWVTGKEIDAIIQSLNLRLQPLPPLI